MVPDPTRDDISFLKRVSEEGRYAPLLGGRYLTMWGSVIAVAYVFQYLIMSGKTGWPPYSLWVMWLVTGLVAAGFMIFFSRTICHKPGLAAISNRVEKWVWMGAGMAIFSFAVGTIAATAFAGAPAILFDMIVAVALGGYGTALFVVHKISGQAWMRWPAIAAFAGAAAIPFVAGAPETYLVGALAIALSAVVPGIVLLRAEPASLPEAA